ncbi:MAG: MlaD family protein [Akkermansia sp.]
MKQKLKPETWVGIFLIAGILMIIGVILGFGNIKTSKEQTYPINIIFKDAAGLIKDSQIRLGGVTVGKVTKAPELLPSGNEVMLEASIQSDVKIQQGSVFRVDMQNILGDKYIDIVPPAQPTHEYILPHATIIGQPESDFSKIKNNAVGATEEILKILKQIEKNRTTLRGHPQYREAAKGWPDDQADQRGHHRPDIQNPRQRTVSNKPGGRTAPATCAAMKDTVRDARKLIAGAEEKLNTLDPAVKAIPPTLAALRKASEQISSFTADARKNQGFLGLLMYDARFRANAQEFIRNLRDYGILRYRNPNEPQVKPDPRGGFSGSRR